MRGTLAELEAVLTVVDHGGFRAAAREIGVSSSALSQQIAALEARIGVRLFNRSTRSVALSAAGEQFVAEITPALAAIRNAIDLAGEHRTVPTGTLRINTSIGATRMILSPLVLEYMRRYPQMAVEIVTEGALVDVNAQGFDAGIRIREAVPSEMIVVPISRFVRPAIVGAPRYLDGHGIPYTPADLMNHRCIRARMASGTRYQWEFERRGEAFTLDVPGLLTLDESDLMLRAAREGAGLAYLNEWQVAEDIAAGRLVQVLAEWTPPYPGLCLYYPGRRHIPAKLRAFVDLVKEIAW
ncbi:MULTISPECIES: LysR family transcriptional regulator [unclassified Rhizobium]|uniref:LysR family transcriptional regulator n=1 Tax=unclassified Rhizobium TaxID=2613769 RepID=UPI0006F92760|nr:MULTISPECIES: LysR family transcriptional regulator [unclassified Rhizobium]KQV37683.1 LysR family transcriptional regulator [Rhizobium sp. Root1212]KRD34585.1 LysR family transcriptional regulator [Rhizobium sp. Root268]